MIYRPIKSRKLWDSWLFPWHDRFHLFHLESQESCHDCIGHAVSDDLLHWNTLPSIRVKEDSGGRWSWLGALTGMVVPHEGKFYMFIGSIPNEQQVIGAYVSDDLEHWKPHAGNPVLYPSGDEYMVKPAPPWGGPVDWRDPSVTWHEEDRHYHAVLFARSRAISHHDLGAVVAHLRSKDLVHWEPLPPVASVGKHFYQAEVPEIFSLEGKYYLTFSTPSSGGHVIHTPSTERAVGTFYMIGSRHDGPYRLPHDPLLVGAGHGNMQAYVGRTIPYLNGRLLYHHVNGDRPCWGAPKLVRRGDDDGLYLAYWPLLEKLETAVIYQSLSEVSVIEPADLGCWQRGEHGVSGRADVAGTSCRVARELSDFHLQCRLQILSAARAGLVLRARRAEPWRDQPGTGGIGVILDFEHQRLQLGLATEHQAMTGWTISVHDTRGCPLRRDQSYELRCFARDEHLEVYLDNRWVFSAVFSTAPSIGDIELCVERGEAEFTALRLATMEALA